MLLFLAMTMHILFASAQQVVFAHGDNWSAVPVQAIDSIKMGQTPMLDVFFEGRVVTVRADSTFWNQTIPDTLSITYCEDYVYIHNPRLDCIQTETDGADVTVTAIGHQPFVCIAMGNSNDGRLIIDSDTTFTLVLSGLNLASQKASAISMPQKQKARIELADGTVNILSDATTYQTDSTDTSNGCFYAKGSLTVIGSGTLGVTGNNRHAISSGKNITVEGGHLIIYNAVKDGIHCDMLEMEGGTIELNMSTDASKGIKCKEDFTMTGGSVVGEASGNVVVENGETSYCSLLKIGGTFQMDGGEISLLHQGDGGRCISVDGNMTMMAGTMNLECHGNGGSYLTSSNETDYHTPKCITVDDSLYLNGGSINCISTGLGGKGIVSDKYLAIGSEGEQEGPFIRVETKGECIINNEDEDQRFGCPKGIKANEKLCIYGGDIVVTTAGMGGEGVESNGTMFIHGGTLECNTFDDGINVTDSIEIAGGQVYCCSADNDGIDSNGSITISDGIVASVNQKKPNESFDAEKGQIFLKGGTVFGIGSGPVVVEEAVYPCYSIPYDVSEEWMMNRGLILTEGKYVCVQKGNKVIIALRNDNQAFRSFLTIMSSSFTENEPYTISEGECPLSPKHSYFDGRLVVGGEANDAYPITDEYFQIIK